MAKKQFEVTVNNVVSVVETAKEAQKLVGNVTLKDILAGKVEGVRIIEADAAPAPAAKEEPKDDAPTDTDAKGADEGEQAPKQPVGKEDAADEGIEYPEVGHFKDEKAMKKYTKKLTDAQLAEWCELEGATYKACEHISINRMRMAMAIKAVHFPDTAPKATAKSKSKYADYTTDQLIAMAMENDVEITGDNGDLRILRMRAIMALREAGLLG